MSRIDRAILRQEMEELRRSQYKPGDGVLQYLREAGLGSRQVTNTWNRSDDNCLFMAIHAAVSEAQPGLLDEMGVPGHAELRHLCAEGLDGMWHDKFRHGNGDEEVCTVSISDMLEKITFAGGCPALPPPHC